MSVNIYADVEGGEQLRHREVILHDWPRIGDTIRDAETDQRYAVAEVVWSTMGERPTMTLQPLKG